MNDMPAAHSAGTQDGASAPVSSHISDGHRLLLTGQRLQHALYKAAQYRKSAVYLPASYFLDTLLPALSGQMNRKVAMRVTAAIARSRKQAGAYGVKQPGPAEYVTEALLDSAYFKHHAEHISRLQLRDRIASLLRDHLPVDLVLPVFSRKPLSPLKNRGSLPDLAEVASLAQLAGAAQVANALSPTGCRLLLLADGHKYRRACNTSRETVDAYQAGLRFWVEALGIGEQVHVIDYEAAIDVASCGIDRDMREQMFRTRCEELAEAHEPMLDIDDMTQTLARLETTPVGSQIAFTLRSMLTSAHYGSTSELGRVSANPYDDLAQRVYTMHVAGIASPLAVVCGDRPEGRPVLPEAKQLLNVLEAMRREAWYAAIRYVAISLVDRELQVVRRRWPNTVKLTIHAKPGELHCITTSRRDVSMTAQHCTGGLVFHNGSAQVDFRYRVEREAEGQLPVLVTSDAAMAFTPERFGPLTAMQASMQPFMYTNDEAAVLEEDVAERLALGDAS